MDGRLPGVTLRCYSWEVVVGPQAHDRFGRISLGTVAPRVAVRTKMKPNPDEDVDELVTPRQARWQFLASKKGSVKDSTLRAYRFPTKHFVEFCEKHDVETTGEISGYVIESWKQERRSENIKIVTLHNNVKHLRVFIRWCESIDLVDQGMADKMTIPESLARSGPERRHSSARPRRRRPPILENLRIWHSETRAVPLAVAIRAVGSAVHSPWTRMTSCKLVMAHFCNSATGSQLARLSRTATRGSAT